MPLPKANPDAKESEKNAFISKCMSAMKDEKKPQDQKVAICMDIWRRRKKKAKASEKIEWEEQVIESKDGDCFILL